MEQSLRRLQEAEIEILRQTLAVLEQHGLRYYMLGGTLLGAVRHRGFIPWDDDIDIGMPRPDYERFLEIAEQAFRAPFQLHTCLNGKGSYGYYYARVENTGVLLEKFATRQKTVVPAWIDVFPLDGVPGDDAELERWFKKCRKWNRLLTASQASHTAAASEYKKKRSFVKSAARSAFLLLRLDRLLNTKRIWKKLDKLMKQYDYETSDRLINLCGRWGKKELFPKAVYGKGTPLPFEDLQLIAPEDSDRVLTQMYGDYMTPPPEEKRAHHHINVVSAE